MRVVGPPPLRRTLAILSLLLLPLVASAQLLVEVEADSSGALATVNLRLPPLQEVLDTLEDGMVSRIRFKLRVGYDQSGFVSLFRSPLAASYEVVREVRFDPFREVYVVREDGIDLSLDPTDDLAEAFFHLRGFPVEVGDFLRCKVELDIVKLVPPMNLLAPLMPDNRRESPWVEARFNGSGP
jgi:hypothetical protein